jgi:hypothetical protein
MAKEILYDNEFATMWYLPEKKMVHHQVHKFFHDEAFQKFLSAGTVALKKYGAHKWLSDDRGMTVFKKEDIEWAMTKWIPETVAAGWKYWAIVQPEKALAAMNLEEFAKTYASMGIVSKFFTDPDAAMKWLEAQ